MSYDEPLPEEWVDIMRLDFRNYLDHPCPGCAFSLGATLAMVAAESDHSPERLLRYLVRDLEHLLDLGELATVHALLAEITR